VRTRDSPGASEPWSWRRAWPAADSCTPAPPSHWPGAPAVAHPAGPDHPLHRRTLKSPATTSYASITACARRSAASRNRAVLQRLAGRPSGQVRRDGARPRRHPAHPDQSHQSRSRYCPRPYDPYLRSCGLRCAASGIRQNRVRHEATARGLAGDGQGTARRFVEAGAYLRDSAARGGWGWTAR